MARCSRLGQHRYAGLRRASPEDLKAFDEQFDGFEPGAKIEQSAR
jgi:hypothetical protein